MLVGMFAAVFFAAPSVAQATAGYVLEQRGIWVLSGSSAPLTRGQKLPAGGTIRRRSNSGDDYITIADTRMNLLPSASRNCANGDCSRAIILPRPAAQRSYLGRAYDALMATIFGSTESNDANLNRTGGSAEGVVEEKDGKVALNSILKAEGEQYLRWRTITFAAAGEWSQPVKLDENAAVSGLEPGLYEINIMRSNGTNYEPTGSSWLLVTSLEDHEKTAASFKEDRDLSDRWGDKVRPETKRLFLRASLENLAAIKPK